MTTIEGNKLIAEFMGLVKRGNVWLDLEDGHSSYWNDLTYHQSWDWLMPVIEKIYSMDKYYEYKTKDSTMFPSDGIEINPKFIIRTWESVVEFIEWYNKQK